MVKNKSVDYFFVGPPKTGTTWIYEILKKTENVSVSIQTKELEFFNKNFHRGTSWYHNSFDMNADKACDISTSYFISETARGRIKDYNPGARIIITIRHPIRRLISHFKHNLKFGILKKMTIEQALKEHPNLLQSSLYTKYLGKWIEEFGRDNVLILPLELLSQNPERYVKMINEFLGIQIDLKKTAYSAKINYASQPRIYFIARYARMVRKKVNDLGLHRIIVAAKKIGLKKLIYEGGADISVDERSVEYLRSYFIDDILALKDHNVPEEIIEKYLNE